MNSDLRRELSTIAEDARSLLGEDVFQYCADMEHSISLGSSPANIRLKGRKSGIWYSDICPAILEELRLLLCTNAAKYSKVRRGTIGLTQKGIAAIAGAMAAKYGIAEAAALGAVSFIVLSLARIGIESACRVLNSCASVK